jgi:uncharacterized protein YfaS (alpha-2-macroglobulin family)
MRDQAAKAAESLQKQTVELTKMLAKLESVHDARDAVFTTAPLPRLDGEMPIGQMPFGRMREHFQETATWQPQLRTDETGTVQATFTLPDSLTRYRLTSLALTKQTEIGVGRARLTTGLPLAVQIVLPRFAVEKDRLQAIALVHNDAAQPRECQFTWQIDGATTAAPHPLPLDWNLTKNGKQWIATGKVKVDAKSSAKLTVWLKADVIGTARLTFRATDGKDADAEVRSMSIQPLGRPTDVNANQELPMVALRKPGVQQLAGKFNKEGIIRLPKGFVATDLHLRLAASDLAQSLDGLDNLIDYPYGCIEQTMSRFLPAVMVKHATRHGPVALQPNVARKLPDILDKGLTRVYSHQHADGSWGWFEKDSRNFAMSVYVVYGLARCQATGTSVDGAILDRGCGYLLEELRTNAAEEELAARAWYALALAGRAPAADLQKWGRQALTREPRLQTSCNLALACREVGLRELGERLWRSVGQQQAQTTEAWALYLNTQLAFGSPYERCRASAKNLLNLRQGTIWAHTRDTSWAIEALANMLHYVPEKNGVRKIEVTIAEKTLFAVSDPAELKKMIFRVHLKGDQLPAQETLEIQMKADADEPIYVSVRAAGAQRLEGIRATGTRVKLVRSLETLDGAVLTAPLKAGQVARVRLRLELAENEEYLLIDERRPSLCEFAAEHVAGSAAPQAVQQEFRDDRLCLFFRSLPAGLHEIVYYLRAETPGECTILPGAAYPMYHDTHRGETGLDRIEVK